MKVKVLFAVEVWVTVIAVVEVANEKAARIVDFGLSTQVGAVTKGVPKVTTQEVVAEVPTVTVPAKSVPVIAGAVVPQVAPVTVGGGPPRIVERTWLGK
jgi:hypothetical protein